MVEWQRSALVNQDVSMMKGRLSIDEVLYKALIDCLTLYSRIGLLTFIYFVDRIADERYEQSEGWVLLC